MVGCFDVVAPLTRRLFVGDDGQDLVEYALLTMFIGLAGLTVWNAMGGKLNAAYEGYDTGSQAIWTCEPGACGTTK